MEQIKLIEFLIMAKFYSSMEINSSWEFNSDSFGYTFHCS